MTIEERVNMLENRLSRTKRINLLTAICSISFTALVLFIAMRFARTNIDSKRVDEGDTVIRAQKFVLEDENGNMRAKLGIKSGGCEFFMYGQDEKERIVLEADDILTGLMLFNAEASNNSIFMHTGGITSGPEIKLTNDGKTRVELAATESSDTHLFDEKGKFLQKPFSYNVKQGLNIFDNEGRPRVILGTSEKADGTLIYYDEKGNTRLWLSSHKKFGNGLSLFDELTKKRIDLRVRKEGSILGLMDTDGNPRITLSALKDNSNNIFLINQNGKPRVNLHLAKDGASLVIADNEGNNRAVLGVTQTNTPDGKTINYPESSLVLFDGDGHLVWTAR